MLSKSKENRLLSILLIPHPGFFASYTILLDLDFINTALTTSTVRGFIFYVLGRIEKASD